MDGVELVLAILVLAIEDAFQIQFSDREAGAVSTIGALHQLIVSKLERQSSHRCLTSAAFYRTRRAIVSVLGMERRQIKPSTLLAPLMPRTERRHKWRQIQDALRLKLPDLEHPLRMRLGFFGVGISLAMLPPLLELISWAAFPALLLIGVFLGGLLIKFSPQLATAFPKRCSTVGDLAQDVVALNHARLMEQVRSWNENEVWDALCRIIIIQTGGNPVKIKPEAAITSDLGID